MKEVAWPVGPCGCVKPLSGLLAGSAATGTLTATIMIVSMFVWKNVIERRFSITLD